MDERLLSDETAPRPDTAPEPYHSGRCPRFGKNPGGRFTGGSMSSGIQSGDRPAARAGPEDGAHRPAPGQPAGSADGK